MKTNLNLQDADGFYEQLLDAHQGLERGGSRPCSTPGCILLLAKRGGR